MCKRRKGAVLAAAAEYLRGEGQEQGAFEVIVRGDAQTHRWQGQVETAAESASPSGLWLSPLEGRIVGALAGRSWTRADDIGATLGESPTGDFRAVLRNLVERHILESAPSKGYRLVGQNGRVEGAVQSA